MSLGLGRYPVIVERAIISRGLPIPETQDVLVGFANSEREVAIAVAPYLDCSLEGIGIVHVSPQAFSTELSHAEAEIAYQAKHYWFVSIADAELINEVGDTLFCRIVSTDIPDIRRKRRTRQPRLARSAQPPARVSA